jgi:hypothetical protein
MLDWHKVQPRVHFRFSPMPVKGGGHDGYSVPLKVTDPVSNEECFFEHQTPLLSMPFGISEKEVGGKMHYKIAFSFPTVRHDPTKNEFFGNEEQLSYYKWIKEIDDFNKDTVVANMKTWFPGGTKAMKQDVLREFYFDNIWIGEKCASGEYPPTFSAKLKVRMKDQVDTIMTKFFNQNKEEISYSDVAGDAGRQLRCYAIIFSNGLWFAGKNYGMSLQVKQLLVYEKDKVVGCAIELPEEPLQTLPPAGGEYEDGEDDCGLEIDLTDKRAREDGSDDHPAKKNVAENFNM